MMSDIIIGVDEAGRGPLAGPVVAAAVVLRGEPVDGLDDSKKLSERQRAGLEVLIRARCAFGIGIASVAEIDGLNILQATMLAMTRAVETLCGAHGLSPAVVLVDGNRLPQWQWPSRAIIGGDASEPAISAASILAKQHRDRIMALADMLHPAYSWVRNKGYGSALHMAALAEHGPTSLHRYSFAPVRKAAGNFPT
jgi:ribonuclease HII